MDLVIIGASYGQGKRAGTLGSYLLALVDARSKDEGNVEYCSFTNLGSGLSDELLAELTA